MPECVLEKECVFYNEKMRGMPTTVDIFKQNFCRGDPESCARYRVYLALGRNRVPPDLFPNQMDMARRCIALDGEGRHPFSRF